MAKRYKFDSIKLRKVVKGLITCRFSLQSIHPPKNEHISSGHPCCWNTISIQKGKKKVVRYSRRNWIQANLICIFLENYIITIQFDYLDQIRYPDLSSNKLIWYGRSFEMVKNLRNR